MTGQYCHDPLRGSLEYQEFGEESRAAGDEMQIRFDR